MNTLVAKIKLPLFTWTKPRFFNLLTGEAASRISIFLLAGFTILFLWYLGEIYYTFNLGYEIREKERTVKSLETEYEKKQTILMKINSAKSLLETETAKSMSEISSLKYLQSKNYFVELRKNIP